uniref:Uncharacterized protein n=1 Tax=Anguilla anguilla TaxID=7936 RepID=A0A0E9TZT6_ANGAN
MYLVCSCSDSSTSDSTHKHNQE